MEQCGSLCRVVKTDFMWVYMISSYRNLDRLWVFFRKQNFNWKHQDISQPCFCGFRWSIYLLSLLEESLMVEISQWEEGTRRKGIMNIEQWEEFFVYICVCKDLIMNALCYFQMKWKWSWSWEVCTCFLKNFSIVSKLRVPMFGSKIFEVVSRLTSLRRWCCLGVGFKISTSLPWLTSRMIMHKFIANFWMEILTPSTCSQCLTSLSWFTSGMVMHKLIANLLMVTWFQVYVNFSTIH